MLAPEKLKEIKAIRVRRCFIDTTAQLIQDVGIEGLSIRKISKIVGYNSATTYNYFENFEHLVTFASLRYLDAYTAELSKLMLDDINALERYIRVFTCFARYSFSSPAIYASLFYGNYGSRLSEIIREYYEMYPEELRVSHNDVRGMLYAGSIVEREKRITLPICQEGFITKEAQEYLVEISISTHERLLRELMQQNHNCSVEEQVRRYVNCICYLLRIMKLPGTPRVDSLGM